MNYHQPLRTTSLNFRNLQTFLVIVEEMSFSQAANRLGTTQPPLSRQIQRLEAQLNVKLFVRTRPRMQLTDSGKAFATMAKNILQQMESSIETVQMIDQGLAGCLSIGIDGAAPAYDCAVKLLSAYQKRYADVEFKIYELSTSQQFLALKTGQIDVGFLTSRSAPIDVDVKVLVKEPLVVALPVEHALTRCSHITFEDIVDIPFIMPLAQSIMLTTNKYFHPQIIQTVSDNRLIMSLVAAGRGISIVPISIRYSQSHPNVVFRPFVPEIQVISLAASWNQRPRPIITPFIEFLTTVINVL